MQESAPPAPGRPGRRSVVRYGLAAGAAAALGGAAVTVHRARSGDDRPAAAARTVTPRGPSTTWSDPDGWDGPPPGPDSHVVLTGPVLLDTDAEVASLTIEATGSLEYAGDRTLTLASAGNVVVAGTLTLAPDRPDLVHTLRLTGADEAAFRGTVMEPTDTDTGVWVVGAGVLRWHGADRTAWIRADGPARAGDTTLHLAADPAGWRPGDEIVVTPTAPPGADGATDGHELRTLTALSGRTLTLDRALEHDHPAVAPAGGAPVGAEVLNLTRNVRVEGTATGRAHVHITSSARQEIRHTRLRWMGPRRDTAETWRSPEGVRPVTAGLTGRYALHFHMLGDASRGTLVEGVVVTDTGHHAFVPHASHGITFRGCVSHDTWEDPYWWDDAPDTRTPQEPSDEVRWEGCVASLVRVDPPFRGYRLAGFSLGAGVGSRATGCVAVGVQGSEGSAGFSWPEGGNGEWRVDGCLAHNNAGGGLFVWQNRSRPDTISHFVAFHNGGPGINHGAYLNDFVYTGALLHGNAGGGVLLHALGAERGATFADLHVDGAGLAAHAVVTRHHQLPGAPVRFVRCAFGGYRDAGASFPLADGAPENVEFIDCTFTPAAGSDAPELRLDDGLPGDTRIVLRPPGGRPVAVLPAAGAAHADATAVPGWNARTRPTDLEAAPGAPRRPPVGAPVSAPTGPPPAAPSGS
ncbi:hypothetical protein [Allostreptomyces psammosilenae]|uniref:G8 domain-containing protein n=1 Tax=Allostreptomyces psammosilenae TaxID=1892865 RepID=A0A852ZR93_9ACTN|nr:hypothetical protein [Allostreptomyces psammosilenae]NYI04966.1 hypothetical protein [Allostreptomyces psammosilenae]